jgi:hypothetical protein
MGRLGTQHGPEVWGMFGSVGPLGQVIKLSMRAAKWAVGPPDREDRPQAVLSRACRKLEELVKKLGDDWHGRRDSHG